MLNVGMYCRNSVMYLGLAISKLVFFYYKHRYSTSQYTNTYTCRRYNTFFQDSEVH